MGQLALPFGDELWPESPHSDGGCRLVVLLDYRPHLDQVETVELDLPPAWGPPAIAHMVLTRMLATREHLEITDSAGDAWPFERETVRAFWIRRGGKRSRG
jgi:hypothetical protein